MQTEQLYILIEPTSNGFIAIGEGCYPYTVHRLHQAKFFMDRVAAEDYASHFPSMGLVVRGLSLSLENQ